MRKILVNSILVIVLMGGVVFLGDYIFQKYSQYNNDRLSKEKSEQLEKERGEKEAYLKNIKEGLLAAKNKGETADMGTLQLTMVETKVLDEYTREASLLFPNPQPQYTVGILMKAYNPSEKESVTFRRTINWIDSSSGRDNNTVYEDRDKYFDILGQEPYSISSDVDIPPQKSTTSWVLVRFDKKLKEVEYLYPHSLYSEDDLIAGFKLDI